MTDLLTATAQLRRELIALRAAGRAGAEARSCACGGIVVADPRRPGPGVRAHQRTLQHRRWRVATFPTDRSRVERTRQWRRRLSDDVVSIRSARGA